MHYRHAAVAADIICEKAQIVGRARRDGDGVFSRETPRQRCPDSWSHSDYYCDGARFGSAFFILFVIAREKA